MKTIRIKTTGLSLLELRDKYPKLFFKQDWYDNEPFAKEKPEGGEFEIVVDKVLTNKTWKEQVECLKTDEVILHPAQYIEGMISHFKEGGERIFEDWYIRTNCLGSDGDRVDVGYFDAKGLNVYSWYDDGRGGSIGVSAARKLSLNSGKLDASEALGLESLQKRVKALEDWRDGITACVNRK